MASWGVAGGNYRLAGIGSSTATTFGSVRCWEACLDRAVSMSITELSVPWDAAAYSKL